MRLISAIFFILNFYDFKVVIALVQLIIQLKISLECVLITIYRLQAAFILSLLVLISVT